VRKENLSCLVVVFFKMSFDNNVQIKMKDQCYLTFKV